MFSLKQSLLSSLMLTLSIETAPESVSISLEIRPRIVDLPLPDLPTKATEVLGSIVKDKSLNIGAFLSRLTSCFFFLSFLVLGSS